MDRRLRHLWTALLLTALVITVWPLLAHAHRQAIVPEAATAQEGSPTEPPTTPPGGRSWTTYTEENGLGESYVQAIALDGEGTIWFGTLGGASRFWPG